MIRHTLKTGEGRTINVAEDGDPKGKAVFVLHGTPSSLMLYPPHVADASKRGIRLISFDRSGYGGSSPHPGRRVADAAKEVAAVADSLGLDRFAVWGISGGGPHTLACGALLSHRVVAAACLASPAPYPSQGLDWMEGQGEDNVAEFTASMAGPQKLSGFLELQRTELLEATPERIAELWSSIIPPVDKEALMGDLGPFLASNMKDAVRPGIAGWRDDDLAFITDWGFKPSDVSVPLMVWQGRHDKMVPFAHGKWIAEHIKGVEAHLTPDDGHLTLFERRIPETHAWLLKRF